MTGTTTVRWLEDGEARQGDAGDLDAAWASGSLIWVDIQAPDEADFIVPTRMFDLHPLAVEDCLHFPQRAKVDFYDDSAFLIWLVPFVDAEGNLAAREIDTFLGERFILTAHREASPAVERAAADAERNLSRGKEWLLHAILDAAVDGFLPLIDAASDELDEIEEAVLDGYEPEILARLHATRRRLIDLHKTVRPERDMLREIARHELLVSTEAFMYFQDVGDHLARIVDELETLREVAAAVTDIHLSVVSNRLNDVMKRLTIVATIFMPLTLVSGIYGMNFRQMPELEWLWGYPVVLGAMGLIAIAMLWYFRRKRWI